jgi:protease secretion system membrane fusion protein
LPISPSAAITRWINSFNPYDAEQLKQDAKGGSEPAAVDESATTKLAVRIFVVFFVVFSTWAIFAPIDSGVTVLGTVVVMGNRKAVQHLGGGVVEEILVREGDKVSKGDTVIKINPLNSQANLTAAELEYFAATASEIRLLAERSGPQVSAIEWPRELKASADPRIKDILAQQEQLFRSRQNEFREQQGVANQQILGLETQLKGQQETLPARQRQLAVVAEDAANSAALAADGYVPRARANELERGRVELEISISSLVSDIGRNQSGLASARLQKMQQLSAHHKEIDNLLADTRKARLSHQARMESLKFEMAMTDIKAPASGIVVGLKSLTVGGVVPAGQTLMEILPVEGKLIAEVDVPPNMIDKVHKGLAADMRFSAFNVNTTPVVPGIVRLIGADRLPPAPPAHPNEYYLCQIEVTDEGLRILHDKSIQPGMPVEVVIKSGERSFMSYLLKPISDRFARSFKE